VAANDPVARIRPATREDAPLLLELFAALAEYEHLREELRASERQIGEALFGERPAAEALIAERASDPAGYALYFPTFSSFLATRGIWLEDLFVLPEHRRAGVGRALLAAVAARVPDGAGRLEWCALDWNELALGFYRALGARSMDGWTTLRLDGADLAALAAEGVRAER
jgi:GNAT superfamily N-acetyltransferase